MRRARASRGRARTGWAVGAASVLVGLGVWRASEPEPVPPPATGAGAPAFELRAGAGSPTPEEGADRRLATEDESRAAAPAERAPYAQPGTRKRWPRWLETQLIRLGEKDPEAPLASNRELRVLGGEAGLNPVHLAVLGAIIEANGLDEASSPIDFPDGDGGLEPLELGYQVWRDGDLVLLAFGPDPYTGYGYHLTGLPPEIGRLDSLEVLDLNGNLLTELPPELGELGALRELRAARNRLGELPYELGALHSLEVLELTRNGLSDLPESMGGLDRLAVLRLDGNAFWEVPDAVLRMQGLRRVGFAQPTGPGVPEGPGLSTLPPELLQHPDLEELVVSGNQLCGGGASFVSGAVIVQGLAAQRC